MFIQKVSFTGLKGGEGIVSLAPATLIAGPNFSGKTRILDAIRLSLLGVLPENGRTNRDTMRPASARRMEVAIQFDDGGERHRALWIDGKTVKSDGTEPEPTPLLDAGHYFSLTDSERIEYVFERVTLPPEYTADGVMARLHKLTFGEEHTEAVQAAKGEVLATCSKLLCGIPGTATAAPVEPLPIREALNELTNTVLAKQYTEWNRRAKDSVGFVRLAAELKNREGECSAETLADLRTAESRTQGLLEEASAELGRLNEQARAATQAADRQAALHAQFEEKEPEWKEPTLEKPTPKPLPEVADLEAELAEVCRKLGTMANPDMAKAQEDWNRAARAQDEALDRYAKANSEVGVAEKEMRDLENHAECPFCKSRSKNWRANLAKTIAEKISNAREEREVAEAVKDKAAKAFAAADKERSEYKAAHEARLDTEQVAEELRRQIDRLGRERARIEQDNRNAQTIAEQNHAHAVEHLTRDKGDWMAAQQRARDELSRIVPGTYDPGSIAAAQRKVEELRAQLTADRAKITEAETLQTRLRDTNAALGEHDLAQARADVIKAVGKTLSEIKGQIIAAAFGDMLKVANEISGDILPSPLAYNAESNEIGRWDTNGQFITHKTFTGAERQLAYVAIAAGLSSKAKFRLLILDEIGLMTRSVQSKVLHRFREAIDNGRLDQVIAVLPLDEGEPLPVAVNTAKYLPIETR